VHTFSPRIDTMPGLCRFLAVSTALALLASPALAQDLAQAPSGPSAPEAVSVPEVPSVVPSVAPSSLSTAPDVASPVVTGPTLANATSGIRANTAHEDLTTAEAAHRAAAGSGGGGINKGALILIVGGAAIAGGILIGGVGGTALAIGGALVALYGIYLLLQ
jgi:hypothetical protein